MICFLCDKLTLTVMWLYALEAPSTVHVRALQPTLRATAQCLPARSDLDAQMTRNRRSFSS